MTDIRVRLYSYLTSNNAMFTKRRLHGTQSHDIPVYMGSRWCEKTAK